MAQAINGNTYYVDTASSGASTCLEAKDVKLKGIIYMSETLGHQVTLNDISGTAPAGAPTAGALKLRIAVPAANSPVYIDLSSNPIRFPNGVWISEIDGGNLCLILEIK